MINEKKSGKLGLITNGNEERERKEGGSFTRKASI